MQCIDAGIVIITHGEEFSVFRHEQIYAIFLALKLFPDMTCDINHCSFAPFEVAILASLNRLYGEIESG